MRTSPDPAVQAIHNALTRGNAPTRACPACGFPRDNLGHINPDHRVFCLRLTGNA
jgi:hypothetical protein